jgi:hypothetical protein
MASPEDHQTKVVQSRGSDKLPEKVTVDPVTTAALAVLGLEILPVDRKQLDLQVSRLARPIWTWNMTAAWQHLWQLLDPVSPQSGHSPERPALGHKRSSERRNGNLNL